MKFTDAELHKMAEQSRERNKDHLVIEGYGANHIPGEKNVKDGGAAAARQRMLDQMRSNPYRHRAEAEEARKAREAEAAERDALRKMSVHQEWEAKAQKERDYLNSVRANLAGYRSAAEYETAQAEKMKGHSYQDRLQRQKQQK